MARSRPRAYLLLARVSNLPTVWTNVLAAVVAAGASIDAVAFAAVAVSLFYTGGMFLNDAFDADVDRVSRADRPIPSGEVSRGEAFLVGSLLIAAGEVLLFFSRHPGPALAWGVGLAAAIVVYDFKHKGFGFGPVVMGLCRALVYAVAAAGAMGTVTRAPAIAAVVMWAYIVTLTEVAKRADLGYAVPWLLAGICLVDAVIIVVAGGGGALALTAAAGFVVTLALQRVVPGT